jgi:hypothetical protein
MVRAWNSISPRSGSRHDNRITQKDSVDGISYGKAKKVMRFAHQMA